MKQKQMPFIQLLDHEITHDHHGLEVGLSTEEYERLKRILNRKPNKVELGIVAALWSEHCSYKSTKAHLSTLPSKGKHVLVGPGENAGVLDIGEDLAVAFKIESHNHPSFIEPFHGSATGVGGILRDIFTMGARPFAACNFLRFGEVSHKKTPFLFNGVVSGIAHYGNSFGVPTVLSNVGFHKSYNGNILVNAFAIGVVRRDKIFLSKASGIKNRLLYVGSKTGRDGIMGAVMASDTFTDQDQDKRPTVQVGDPFCEKLLLEACLLVFDEQLVVGIQDMGAAGLTSSSFEMASKASTGLHINLDNVPLRDASMSAYDIMLSESQERMLMVVEHKNVARVKQVFEHYDLDCVDIGFVTGDGMVKINYQGHEVVNLSATMITENAPRYRRNYISKIPGTTSLRNNELAIDAKDALDSMSRDINQKDLSYITNQFDHHIGLNTIVGPGESDAALIRVPHTNKAVAISLVGHQNMASLCSLKAAARCVYQAYLEVSAQGCEALGITNCLNFGSPENIDVMTDIKNTIDGMAEAAASLNLPIISGNVSLYNETNNHPILPTLALSMVGITNNIFAHTKFIKAKEGDVLVSLGDIPHDFAGCESIFSDQKHNNVSLWDPAQVIRLGEILKTGVRKGLIECVSIVSTGGLLHSVIKLISKTGLGAVINFGNEWLYEELSIGLLSENACQALISIPEEKLSLLSALCAQSVTINKWGHLIKDKFIVRHHNNDIICRPSDQICTSYLDDLGEIFAQY